MSEKVTDRITPFVERYRDLTEREAEDIEFAKKVAQVNGIFTIPILEKILKAASEEANRIVSEDIPCLLAEYGLSEVKTLDGTEISKATFYETSQSGKDKNMLSAWLEFNGYGSIIKDTLALDKGEFDDDLAGFLNEHGYSYSRDSNVNGQTLKKTIKDHILAGGQMPPEEAVKVTIFERAVVKPPKESKGF